MLIFIAIYLSCFCHLQLAFFYDRTDKHHKNGDQVWHRNNDLGRQTNTLQRNRDRLGVAKDKARKRGLERMAVADHDGRKGKEAFTCGDVFRKHGGASDGQERAAEAAQHTANQNCNKLILGRVDADGLRCDLFDTHTAKTQSKRCLELMI